MAVLVDGTRNGEACVMESLHKGEFFNCGETRHVHPARTLSLAQVVSFLSGMEKKCGNLFNRTERNTAEALEL